MLNANFDTCKPNLDSVYNNDNPTSQFGSVNLTTHNN